MVPIIKVSNYVDAFSGGCPTTNETPSTPLHTLGMAPNFVKGRLSQPALKSCKSLLVIKLSIEYGSFHFRLLPSE